MPQIAERCVPRKWGVSQEIAMYGNDFGKDLGLVHEAVVTGRKVNAGIAFWNALAESVKTFNLIEPLARHAAVVNKFSVDVTKIPDEQAIEEFGEWLRAASGGCITCILVDAKLELLGIKRPDNFDSLTHNEQDKIRQNMHEEALHIMEKMIMEKLGAMHIHPAEVGVFTGWEWNTEHNCLDLDDQRCISDSAVVSALQTIRIQRQFMAAMQKTDRK